MSETWLFEHEALVLRSLLRQALDTEQDRAWDKLEESGALYSVAATFFLLDVDPRGDVETFTVYKLGQLLQYLTRRTEQLQVELRGRVRGRVVWPATYKARYTQDYDPSRYVCREVHHQYDTPENQLVRYMAERIAECIKAVPEGLRAGACYFAASQAHRPLVTAVRLGNMRAALNRFRRNVYMQAVSLPPFITEEHQLRADTAALDEYRLAVRLYRQYQKLVASLSWEEMMKVGQRVLPLPHHPAGENDLWLRLGAEILSARAGRAQPQP